MIKRISILFNTHLRKKMESDEQFRICPGLKEAQQCLNAILAMYLHPRYETDYQPLNERVAKYFDDSCTEWKTLCALFNRASRINIVLNYQSYSDGSECVCLELRFVSRRQGQNQEEYIRFGFHRTSEVDGFTQSLTY